MIGQAIESLLFGLLASAVEDAFTVPVVNDGPPARFVALHPESGVVFSAFVPTGELVRVHRTYRLIVEPIDSVTLRPLCCVTRLWVTQ